MRTRVARWLTVCSIVFQCALLAAPDAQVSVPVDPSIPTPRPRAAESTTPVAPPSIYGISGGGTVEVGQKIVLTVYYWGAAPTDVTYQWKKNGTELPGATSISYSIAAAEPGDAGTYTATVTNLVGSSVAATDLTVRPLAAPAITIQPRSLVLEVGQTATFTVGATGSYPRTYQWKRDGIEIAGATAATYSIPAITINDAAGYSVVITNSQGSATSNAAALTVNAATPPVISSNSPSDVTVTAGGTVRLYVNVERGSSPFTYQWYKDGQKIAGASASELVLNPVAVSDSGKYSAAVSNIAGSATSRAAIVTVNPPTPITITQQPSDQTLYEGQALKLDVWFTVGTLPITFQWLKDGVAIPGATNSVYNVNSVRNADAGRYSVVVTNPAGSVTSAAAAVVVKPADAPTISVQPSDATVTEGDSAVFSVTASGTEPLKYVWYRNGTPLTSSERYVSFTAGLKDGGSYYVVISNAAGSVTSRSAMLAVMPLPVPPVALVSSQSVTAGQSFSLSANLDNVRGSLRYQWYRDGVAIPGATNSSYWVSNTSAQDAGDYFMVVSNTSGSTTSRTARVTVGQGATAPAGAWVSAVRGGDIAYFVFTNPARIERYDLVAERWLPPITISRVATAFTVSQDALFLASGSIIYRYALDGTGETILNSAFDSSITGLAMYENYLLAASGSANSNKLTVLQPTDGKQVSQGSYLYLWSGPMAAAPAVSRVFGLTTSLSHITYTTIQANGAVAASATESESVGGFPSASRVYVFPGQTSVADNAGLVYRTSDMALIGTLGGKFDDLSFSSTNDAVVLRGTDVFVYDGQLHQKGRLAVGLLAARIFVHGQDVFAFGYPPVGGSMSVAKKSLSQASAPPTATPLDAKNLAFTPDATLLDRDGVVLLYSKVHGLVFRWSTSSREYLPPLPLQGWPNFVAYSAINHRLYTGYADNRVLQVQLDAGMLTETAFAAAPVKVLGLATAGEYVFLVDASAYGESYFSYAPSGALVARFAVGYVAREYTWNPVSRLMYQFRENGVPTALLYTEITTGGQFGKQNAPYTGPITIQYPIRVSPDGSSVLTGSGRIYDARLLTVSNSIANAIDDAAWVNGRLVTGRAVASGVQLQRWGGSNYAQDASRTLSGRLLRLAALSGNRLLVVTLVGGVPAFSVFDEGLNQLSSDSGAPTARLVNLATRAMAGRDDQSLIPGFVIAGSKSKRVLIRAAGPALVPFGVTNAVADPKLALINSAGVTISQNDDWSTAANLVELTAATTKVGAFPFGNGSKDAAALALLAPGAYTVQTSSGANTAGVALVEIYDADEASPDSRIINIAARAQVGTGGDILIPGIVVQGTASKTLLIRAVGPGLTKFGVSGALADPKLRLYRGEQFIVENDNWDQSSATASDVSAATAKAGAFALTSGSKDAVLLVTLEPGSYTAQVSGVSGGTGVALVEVYEVP